MNRVWQSVDFAYDAVIFEEKNADYLEIIQRKLISTQYSFLMDVRFTETAGGWRAATAVEALADVLASAAQRGASDIHCDPGPGGVHIRFRVDGIIEEAGVLPGRLHDEFVARLKILSGARTDVHAVPQDGRWQEIIGGISYAARVSFMPTYHGENAVVRLLKAGGHRAAAFDQLGFIDMQVQMLHAALRLTSGIILVTGPTGSGKTTTLHACLTAKARENLSIITLEDPVEYEIPGVRQIHIRHSHGVTFASGLRAALRQDPDVIMVGEIRDNETARTAIHTALTGHLVLSTLHTVSAIEAIQRLTDMGIDRYILASTLKLLIGQRLVRRVCSLCRAAGCDACRGSGYAGRSVIAEVCHIDATMRRLISEQASLEVLRTHAANHGFVSMAEDGEEKLRQGITTREELLRVLGES